MAYKKIPRQPLLRSPQADNDHERLPDRCPTCGRPYPEAAIQVAFAPGTSALLDLVVIAKDALTEIQVALEQEVGL